MAATYTDEGVSGAKGRNKRPGFDALCGLVRAHAGSIRFEGQELRGLSDAVLNADG